MSHRSSVEAFERCMKTICDRRKIKTLQVQSFKDLPLGMEVQRSIKELGYGELFPIQAQAIMPLLEGKDVIGQAQTGTGKTAAFGVPMVERLDPQVRKVQGLILAPTRELAMQVARNMACFAKYRGLRVLPVYGEIGRASCRERV